MKRILTGLVALLLVLSLVGCATVSTEPDEQAVAYNGGAFTASTYDGYVGSSAREWFGPGDKTYVYPLGQRTFSFNGADGSERGPYDVTTKDSQVVSIAGFVTFTLTSDEKLLRAFHERIGKKYGAYKGGGPDGKGWNQFLLDYVDVTLASAMTDAGLQSDWKMLYAVPAEQTQFEQNVKASLPAQLEGALGGKYITVNAVQIKAPVVAADLQAGLTSVEAAKLAKTAQDEQNTANISKYQTFTDCAEAGVSEDTCTLIYLSDQGKVPFYPLPVGGNVNINPPVSP